MNERIKELAEQAGMSYLKFISQEQMELVERFAELIRQDEREVVADEFFNCLQSDLEHGVKCLNETASSNFEKQYQALSKFCDWINEGRTE